MTRTIVVAIILLALACGEPTAPSTPPTILPVPAAWQGRWVATPAHFRLAQINIFINVDASSRVTGPWRGVRANCSSACIDSGFVITGILVDSTIDFRVKAINSTYSMRFVGTYGVHTMRGSAAVFEDGINQPSVPLTFTR